MDMTNNECTTTTTTIGPKRSVILRFNVLEVERVADHGAVSITVRHWRPRRCPADVRVTVGRCVLVIRASVGRGAVQRRGRVVLVSRSSVHRGRIVLVSWRSVRKGRIIWLVVPRSPVRLRRIVLVSRGPVCRVDDVRVDSSLERRRQKLARVGSTRPQLRVLLHLLCGFQRFQWIHVPHDHHTLPLQVDNHALHTSKLQHVLTHLLLALGAAHRDDELHHRRPVAEPVPTRRIKSVRHDFEPQIFSCLFQAWAAHNNLRSLETFNANLRFDSLEIRPQTPFPLKTRLDWTATSTARL